MAATPVIRVEGLGKQYRLGSGVQYGRLTESLWEGMARPLRRLRGKPTSSNGRPNRFLWALRDFDLEVHEGEAVGIIGKNGAGKTTLLKLLSRITEPTAGYAELYGRVGSLLEVGSGFHPELTGRENIYLNGAILGMSRSEIARKFDEIVEFAEIERFMDTPVKRYSNGMYVRLAFSVSAFLEPEIQIVDEVLAVGDISFQKKCLGKMGDVARTGRTVLFVSHNMGAVAELCPRVVLLDRGRLIADGRNDHVISQYLDSVHGASAGEVTLDRDPALPMQVTELWCEDHDGERTDTLELGEDLILCLRYEVRKSLRDSVLAVLVSREGSPVLYTYDTDTNTTLREQRAAGKYEARVGLPFAELKEGVYTLEAMVGHGMDNLTDPHANIVVNVVNTHRDLTHVSYRADRLGVMAKDLDWQTRLSDE